MHAFRHIYVHLPFCDVICHYCSFYTARSSEARHEEFFSALAQEARSRMGELGGKLEAIYFGGGTPGASPPEFVHKFLDLFRDHIQPSTEVTLETNPTNVSPERVAQWSRAGINRISLGVQSLSDPMLKRLGRAHSGEAARIALRQCLQEIPNVTCDVMYGVPGQAENEPMEHALELVGMGAKHISAYHLTLEPQHFLFSKLPTDAFAWDQIRKIAEALAPLSFHHYEVASFALPGRESRNNRNYWTGGPYLALGPSAHGFDGTSTRWWNIADWEGYVKRLQAGQSPLAETEQLTRDQRRLEVIFTSLRTSEGLDLGAFSTAFQEDLLAKHAAFFARWEKEHLGTVTNGRFVLTFTGRMLADEIARQLL